MFFKVDFQNRFNLTETDSLWILISIRLLRDRVTIWSSSRLACLNRIGITFARPHVIQMTSTRVCLLELHLGRSRQLLQRFQMISRWTDLDIRFWLYYSAAAFRRANHMESGPADLPDSWLKLWRIWILYWYKTLIIMYFWFNYRRHTIFPKSLCNIHNILLIIVWIWRFRRMN